MTKHHLWLDEYWLLLLQLYLKKPQGVKPVYDRNLVNIALDLHIVPEELHEQMKVLAARKTRSLQVLWDKYARHPKKLTRQIELWRQMRGFGHQNAFFAGVKVCESWEKDFQPISGDLFDVRIIPVQLIVVLDLYFRLVPDTMVPMTPEIVELSKQIQLTPEDIVDVMHAFQVCDPLITHEVKCSPRLHDACMKIWKRYGNEDSEKLSALATKLKAYWA